MKVSNRGVTRHVLLIGKYAIKIPRLNYGWSIFLRGLLCNMQEVGFSKTKDKRLCPILWYVSGGFMIIMKRCDQLTESEFDMYVDINYFHGNKKYKSLFRVPVENKFDSFGWHGTEIVAIDYGS